MKRFWAKQKGHSNPRTNLSLLVYDNGMQKPNSNGTWHNIFKRLDNMVRDEEMTAMLFHDEPFMRDVSCMGSVALRTVIQNLDTKRAEDVPLHEALQQVLEEHKQNHRTALLLGTSPEKEVDLAHQFITGFLERSLAEMKHTEKDI